MPPKTYIVAIHIDVFNGWDGIKGVKVTKGANREKLYYDLVELTPNQVKAIIKMTKVISRADFG